jgi:dihydropteroate synthase
MPATHIALDPGIGFGKTPGNNLALLRRMSDLAPSQQPLVVGVSRKSFIGKVLGLPAMEDRSWPTVALTCHSRERGARVFRVHEVKPNVEALRMTEAILGQ